MTIESAASEYTSDNFGSPPVVFDFLQMKNRLKDTNLLYDIAHLLIFYMYVFVLYGFKTIE